MLNKIWFIYIIETSNGQLYTGVTTDVERRFKEHQASSSRTAKSLRGKGPLTLRFSHQIGDKGAALSMEYKIKKLTRAKKLQLIEGHINIEQLMRTKRRLDGTEAVSQTKIDQNCPTEH